jgi:hypothetical protein
MTHRTLNFLVAAALAAAPLSIPQAAQADIGGYKNPTEPATPIVYPNCPRGYDVIRRAAYVFKCRSSDPIPDNTPIVLLPVDPELCAPTDYWTSASIKPVTYQGGLHFVLTCTH